MKRTAKRSRMVGILATLLAISLVGMFAMPLASAAPNQKERPDRDERCKDQASSRGKEKRSKECEESQEGDSSSKGDNSQARSKAESSNSDRKGNGSQGRSNSSKSDPSATSSEVRSNNSNSRGNGSEGGSKSQGGGKSGGFSSDGATHPPGNNGTVKIDGVVFDDHPDNEPHPRCVFQVDFYGYDEGDLTASVTFTAHPPTQPSGEVVLAESDIAIGEDAAMGGTDLDATRTYTLDLSGYTAHPVQGHHVKLTVNAEGSQGADVKHKVFWVECPPPGDEVGGNGNGNGNGDGNGNGPDATEEDDDDVLGTVIQRSAPEQPEVAGQVTTEEAESRGGILPFTGGALAPFVIAAIVLMGAGGGLLLVRRLLV